MAEMTEINAREFDDMLHDALVSLIDNARELGNKIAAQTRDLVWQLVRERDDALSTAAVALRRLEELRDKPPPPGLT